jgi:hypothetical protein
MIPSRVDELRFLATETLYLQQVCEGKRTVWNHRTRIWLASAAQTLQPALHSLRHCFSGKRLGSTGYNPWLPRQPDNAGGKEDCGSLHRNGGLNDISCPLKLAFFCELEVWWHFPNTLRRRRQKFWSDLKHWNFAKICSTYSLSSNVQQKQILYVFLQNL